MRQVLFVCSHNTIRSPMAEAVYNHFSKRSRAQSAGLEPGSSVKTEVLATLSRHGVSGSGLRPKKLTAQMASDPDLVVFLTRNRDGLQPAGAMEWDVPLPESQAGYEALFSALKPKCRELAAKVDRL